MSPPSKSVHNCRLLVKGRQTADVSTAQGVWGNVSMVDFLTEKPITCPICMDEPNFPRITRCGHIYCLPCLIRFRHALGNSCAICAEFILTKEIRPCRIQLTPNVMTGSLINFILVEVVDQHSVLPVGAAECHATMPPAQTTPGWWLSRAVRISAAEVARHLARESQELQRRLAKELYLDDEEATGLVMADEEVGEQLKQLSVNTGSQLSAAAYSPYIHIADDLIEAISTEIPTLTKADPHKTYFYQCSSGAAIFLDPLCARALLTEFADQDWTKAHLLPRSLHLLVTNVDSLTVDEGTQRRHRFMAHLNVGDSAAVCDVDLPESLVSNATRSLLAKALDRRARETQERLLQDQRDEDRRRQYEAKAAKETLKLFNVYRPPQLIPTPEDFVPLPVSSSSSIHHPVPLASSPSLTFAQIAARPAAALPASAGLIDSFVNHETQPRPVNSGAKKKKKSVFRLAG